MQSVSNIRWLLSLMFAFSFFGIATPAFAATLELSPGSPSVSVGDTFTLIIYANSDQAINAVTASLSFSSDLLSVVSISKSGSAFTLWVQEPSFSNAAGTIDLSGIVPDPGTSGRSRVLAIQMRAKKAGVAQVRFVSAATLANDGQGTNILTGTVSSSVTISAAAQKPVQTTPPQTQESEPTEVSPATAPAIVPPTITRYSRTPRELEPIVVMGTTPYKNALITVHLANNGLETTGTTHSAADGAFAFVQEEGLSRGEYLAYADVAQDGAHSASSNLVRISVGDDTNVTVIGMSLPVAWILWSFALLPLILLALAAYAVWRIRHLKRTMDRNLHDVAESLHYAAQKSKHRARSAHVKGVLEEMKDRIESTLSELHEELH